ncbi:MAG TPA: hypothetical protein VIJ71_01555 [Mycobacteriales bacterium]
MKLEPATAMTFPVAPGARAARDGDVAAAVEVEADGDELPQAASPRTSALPVRTRPAGRT